MPNFRESGISNPPVRATATHGGAYPPGGHGLEDEDLSPAAEHATRHAGSDADPSLFTTILGALSQKRQSLKDEDVDEEGAYLLTYLFDPLGILLLRPPSARPSRQEARLTPGEQTP